GLKHFEAKIRPVLVEKCYSCHSAGAKALRGGLLLDTKEGLILGGDSGPALVVGKPEESSLIQALKFESFEMPPSGKLADNVIADFEHWVKIGAPDPRVGPAKVVQKKGIDLDAGRKFWSFRPVVKPAAPQVKHKAWPHGDIDRFIAAKLDEKGLQPAPDAERAVWLRRVTFDLLGLPPTPAELDAFAVDQATDAYEKVVDRLLASPHFGERWGRHWLDVARFAESSGGGRSMVFKEAWRYRDYVVEAFNRDKPLDRFIVEQIAGDLLPHAGDDEERDHLVATSYLVLGANNYEEQDKKVLEMDVADEQIEAIGKGLLGMTIGCARCHDHKFDPIPTADYYALAGIFRSTSVLIHDNVSRWVERPLPMSPELEKVVAKHEAEVAALKQKIDTAKAVVKQLTGPSTNAKTGIVAASSLEGIVVDDAQAKRVGPWSPSKHFKRYVGDGYVTDDDEGKGLKTLTFQPEFKKAGVYDVRLGYIAANDRANAVPISLLTVDGEIEVKVDMRQTPPIDGRFVSLGKYRFDPTNQWFVMISNEETKGYVTVDCLQLVPVDEKPAVAAKDAKPKEVVSDDRKRAAAEVDALEKQMKTLQASGPSRPMTMAVDDAEKVEDCKICIRGNVHNRGSVVPRGVLQVATAGKWQAVPEDQSGRLQLAEWVASSSNPLTSRVYVNRVWHHLFGAGLVRTVDNFGTTGETPSHPELLDYLASEFTASNWSTKRLVRSIALSHVYRTTTNTTTTTAKQGAVVDPDNRLLSHMNRRRLDAESIRDAILVASGKLDRKLGGLAVDDPSVLQGVGTVMPTEYGYVFTDVRRSIYTPAFRNRTLELFEAFDFADPNSVTGKRNISTVAPQALYLLNSPFVMEQASAAAARSFAEHSTFDDEQRIEAAFRDTLGRAPTDRELQAGLAAVVATSPAPTPSKSLTARKPRIVSIDDANEPAVDPRLAAWERLYQALFGCVDFRYVD
ncbi:MAG: DUF1553 domain-containing protein, partial [Planctomycetia bacterium]|nr:DUF1553 domain-containing protein [Planctomycetia bacterium]